MQNCNLFVSPILSQGKSADGDTLLTNVGVYRVLFVKAPDLWNADPSHDLDYAADCSHTLSAICPIKRRMHGVQPGGGAPHTSHLAQCTTALSLFAN